MKKLTVKKKLKINGKKIIKADYLENKAIQNENLLSINGGVKHNISLGKKVSNLLINSIHTKLTIIDSMGNN